MAVALAGRPGHGGGREGGGKEEGRTLKSGALFSPVCVQISIKSLSELWRFLIYPPEWVECSSCEWNLEGKCAHSIVPFLPADGHPWELEGLAAAVRFVVVDCSAEGYL